MGLGLGSLQGRRGWTAEKTVPPCAIWSGDTSCELGSREKLAILNTILAWLTLGSNLFQIVCTYWKTKMISEDGTRGDSSQSGQIAGVHRKWIACERNSQVTPTTWRNMGSPSPWDETRASPRGRKGGVDRYLEWWGPLGSLGTYEIMGGQEQALGTGTGHWDWDGVAPRPCPPGETLSDAQRSC